MARIVGIEGQSVDQIAAQVDAGGRFVCFEFVVSFLVLTFRRPTDIFFVPPGGRVRDFAVFPDTITLLLGWWGIPWGPIWSIAALRRNAQGGRDVTDEAMQQLGRLGPRGVSPELLSRQCLVCLAGWKWDPADGKRLAEVSRWSGVSTEDLELLLDQVDVFAIECAVRWGLGEGPLVKEGLISLATALDREFDFPLADYNRFEAAVRSAVTTADPTWLYVDLDELATSVAACVFRCANHLRVQPKALDAVADRFRDHVRKAESCVAGLTT